MRYSKAAVASLLAGMILFLDALAACPELHELIHPDADKASHECAVTMFTHGKVGLAVVDVLVPVSAVQIEPTPRIEYSVFVTTVENLPLGRTPPVLPTAS